MTSTKYAPIARYLAAQPSAVREVTLTVAEIERLIDAPLPRRARAPRWWVNTRAEGHARAWMEAGWRVEHKALWSSQPAVTFVRAAAP